MKRVILTAVLAVAAVGALAPVASARWYLNKPAAEIRAVRTAYQLYDITDADASCRRQLSKQQEHYPRQGMSHRWVCGWSGYDTDDRPVDGQLIITGTDGGAGHFYSVARGIGYA